MKTSSKLILKRAAHGSFVLAPKAALPTLAACLASALSVSAQSAPASASAAASAAKPAGFLPAKPAWVTDLSLGIKESWDNNVYLVSGLGAGEKSAFITTVSPKIGFNLAPLLGKGGVFQALALGYAPDFVNFSDASAENYNVHRFATTVKGKSGNFSFNADNGFNYVDGSKDGHIYAGKDSSRSAYATAVTRERKLQMQDRAKITLQYDTEQFFVRPTASLLYYDLMTHLKTTAGYQNYADRNDVNGGLDLGYKLTKDVALTLGYRYGHQYQQQYPLAIDSKKLSSSSDYQRGLVGIEGKPWKWLTVSVVEGPDFRAYEPNSPTHTTPVSNRHTVKNYGEAAITAEATSQDAFNFKFKQWQWVSSTGKVPYLDSTYDLSYRHKFSKDFSMDLGAKLGTSDYTSSTVSGNRNDWQYTYSIGLNYNFTPNLSASLAYAVDLGRNMQEGLATADNKDYRQFDHHLVSVGAVFKF